MVIFGWLLGKLSPYGNGPTTSAEDDFEALERLKPKTYKAMEDPHFMKSKYKSLYAPIKCTVSFQVMILNVWVPEVHRNRPVVNRKWNRTSCWRVWHSKIVETSCFSFGTMCSFWSRRFRLSHIITIKIIFIWISNFLFSHVVFDGIFVILNHGSVTVLLSKTGRFCLV